MKHTITLSMNGVTMDQLDRFVDKIPADAELKTLVSWTGTDNLDGLTPEDLIIELQAEWES